jgi:hypothetical protein
MPVNYTTDDVGAKLGYVIPVEAVEALRVLRG